MLSDPDQDGLPSGQDNCPNTYNPNQANCDGDNKGDACDSVNGTWVLESTDQRSFIFESGVTPGGSTWCDVWRSIRNTYRDTSACGGGTNVDCNRFYVFTKYDSECSFFIGPPSC